MWQLLVVDLKGRARAYLQEHGGFRVTRRLNGHASFVADVDAEGLSVPQLGVGDRAIKLYKGSTLRFHGQVWEPLVFGPKVVRVEARDPVAVLPWRRVRANVTHTAVDAGLIAFARLDAQNPNRHTGLRPGSRDVSINRTRTYLAGQREDEILDELAGAADGFFYVGTPVDNEPGVFAKLDIRFPNAGTTRPEARFEYGIGTLANLADYEVTRQLPLNRVVVASSNAAGGRLAVADENAASISRYGLFEDEFTYNDVTDATLLTEHAEGSVRTVPTLTLKLGPTPAGPLLFTDFDVGDFVRVRVRHASVDLHVWARVLEATLHVDLAGVELLESIVVETLTGAQPSDPPHLLFRRVLDADRRRLEALERRVMSIVQTATTPPGAPAPDESGDSPPSEGEPAPGSGTPAQPAPPAPPPAPAPSEPPTVSGVVANGVNSFSDGKYVDVSATVDPKNQGTTVTATLSTGGSASTSISGGAQGVSFRIGAPVGGGTATITATNASGSASGSDGYTVGSVPLG